MHQEVFSDDLSCASKITLELDSRFTARFPREVEGNSVTLAKVVSNAFIGTIQGMKSDLNIGTKSVYVVDG